MTTLNTVNTLMAELMNELMNENNKNKNVKLFKVVMKALFLSGIDNKKIHEQDLKNLVKLVELDLLKTFNIASTASDIQSIYDNSEYGSSCMSLNGGYRERGRVVGRFYETLNIQLATIKGARGLINPENNSFYKSYGENHFLLESLLLILGYKNKENWLDNKKIITSKKIIRQNDIYKTIKKEIDKVYVELKFYSLYNNNWFKYEWNFSLNKYDLKIIGSTEESIYNESIIKRLNMLKARTHIYNNMNFVIDHAHDTVIELDFMKVIINKNETWAYGYTRKVIVTEKIKLPKVEHIDVLFPYIDGNSNIEYISEEIYLKINNYKKYLILNLDKFNEEDNTPALRGKFIKKQKIKAYKNKNKKNLSKLLDS